MNEYSASVVDELSLQQLCIDLGWSSQKYLSLS